MGVPTGTAIEIIEAMTQLIRALAWPAVVLFGLIYYGPSLRAFIATVGEIRLKGGGFQASARRGFNLDETSQRLHNFWRPGGGRINRANAAQISMMMRELGIPGTVAWLISAGTPQDRARVAARLSLDRKEI